MPKKSFDYDLIVLGSGSAGFAAAEAAANSGASVCVIEAGKLGGECPNSACVPSKALLKSARLYESSRNLASFGVHAGAVTYGYPSIIARKEAVVSSITGNGKRLKSLAKELGIEIVKGFAEFVDPHTVAVGRVKLSANSIVLATGSVENIPPFEGARLPGIWSFSEAISSKTLPKSIAIIGAGPVGCEMATFYAMLGCRVVMLQRESEIMPREDAELAAMARACLVLRKVDVRLGVITKKVSGSRGAWQVQYAHNGKDQTARVEAVLLAAGKRANIDKLFLANAGVAVDERGHLILNEHLQTSVPHIFAAGDVTGQMMFTHVAHMQGLVVGANAVSSKAVYQSDLRVVPRATFVEPELASVGMTAIEAVKAGYKIKSASFPIGALGRAHADGENVGMIKIVIDSKSRQILGCSMLGSHAGEVIHEAALAMQARLAVDVVANMIHAFPTYSEALSVVAGLV